MLPIWLHRVHLIAFQRQDGASTLRFSIAARKAGGALALGLSSRKIGNMAPQRPSFVASLGPISPPGIVPAAGGVIVVGDDGQSIGAVGINCSNSDEACALAGIRARWSAWRPRLNDDQDQDQG